MATGNWLNELRTALRPRSDPGAKPASSASAGSQTGPQAASPSAPAPRPTSGGAPQSSGLLARWLKVLERAQPLTNAVARATSPLIEPLERRGWGDELLVYARKK